MPIDFKTQFAREQDGAVAVIVALLMVVLLGFTALGVDTASLYRDRSKLQSISDLAALSAVADTGTATARATGSMTRNGMSAADLGTLETGRFLRNPALAPQDRFTALPPGSPGINAIRVVLQDDAPLHFSRIFTDDSHVALNRTALSTRTGAASFALDSHLAHLDTAALNQTLTQTFGASATLDAGVLNALAEVEINLGALLAVLNARAGGASRNPADVLNLRPSAGDVIHALRSVLPTALAAELAPLGDAATAARLDVAALVGGIDTQLGLTATDFLSDITLSARDVIDAIIAAQPVDAGVTLAVSVDVPGVISAQTSVKAGEPPTRSGWIALGEPGVQLHRAAVRLRTDIEVSPDALGNLGVGVQVARVHLPIYAELAGSSATLTGLDCRAADPADIAAEFATAHSPLHPNNGTALAALYLGNLPDAGAGSGLINPADLDFADLLTLSVVIDLPLLPDVTIPGITIQARSKVSVGTSRKQSLTFSHRDIANDETRKVFGTANLLSSATRDLLSSQNTEFRVKPGQSGLVSGLASPVIAGVLNLLPGRLLSGLAAPLDGVLDGALDATGIAFGAGELTLTGHHCEPIRLVR